MAALVRVLPFFLLALYAIASLLQVEWFENHETTSYLARVVETAECWKDGNLRARWFPDLAAGEMSHEFSMSASDLTTLCPLPEELMIGFTTQGMPISWMALL